MEFLVEKTTRMPATLTANEAAAILDAEAAAVAALAAENHLWRLWRSCRDDGEITIGLWAANDEAELERLLARLPLRKWMSVNVIPLRPHHNEPRQVSAPSQQS